MAAPRDIAVEKLLAEALRRSIGELLAEIARLREENAALPDAVAQWSLTTLCEVLIKIGARWCAMGST